MSQPTGKNGPARPAQQAAEKSAPGDRPLGLDSFQKPVVEAGLSLDQLSQAFVSMLGSGDDPYSAPRPGAAGTAVEADDLDLAPLAEDPIDSPDACEVSPRSILEAMLFVGLPDNQPLTSQQVAGLMRGVRTLEIDDLVRELNSEYRVTGCPYTIVSEGAGYRLKLRDEFAPIRDRLYGRVRQARLSPAAIEVLSIVAYNEPLTAEDVSRARGTASGPILAQLVRRQLLEIVRLEEEPRVPRYRTTQRFLTLFGLQSLGDLPRSQDLDRQ